MLLPFGSQFKDNMIELCAADTVRRIGDDQLAALCSQCILIISIFNTLRIRGAGVKSVDVGVSLSAVWERCQEGVDGRFATR